MASFITRAGGYCFFLGSAGWTYGWEAIRGVLYEQAWLTMSENADIFFHYVVPLLLVVIGTGLFILSMKQDRRRDNSIKAPKGPDRIPLVELRGMQPRQVGISILIHPTTLLN